MSDRRELLTCAGLRVGWHGRALLPPIDLTIRQGDFWAVIGRNGSGKTTLFKTLLGLIPPVEGAVTWHGQQRRLSYVAQRGDIDLRYPATARDVVAMGTERGLGFFGPFRPRHAREQTRLALERVEATTLAGMPYSALSEGQKQRVMLARVVAGRPTLALLDEPTAAMDVRAEEEVLALIDRLRAQYDMAVVIVSHFLGVASRFAEHVLLVDNERQSVRIGAPEQVLGHVDFATAAALADATDERHP